jgi:hypothetical protein
MPKIKFMSMLFICALLMSSCQPAAQTVITPTLSAEGPTLALLNLTPLPTATITQMVIEATDLPTATSTPLPPIVVAQPTIEPTLELDPNMQGRKIPPALIQIDAPGSTSRVASPIQVKASVYPGDQGLVSVQLIGENGRLMADQLLKMSVPDSGWVSLATKIQFEINSAGESGLIVVTTRDGYGRRIAQSAIPVLLLQIGRNEIENPDFFKQPYLIDSPVSGGVSKNGIVNLTGFAHPFNGNALVFELVTQTGGILASQAYTLPKIPEGQEYAPFTLEIPYSVNQRTPVRLTIRQTSDVFIGEDMALGSQIIYLDP